MPPDFRLLLRGALITTPSLLAACNKPPPAVAPEEATTATLESEAAAVPTPTAELEPGQDHDAPRIRSAQFINPQRIRLTFTEPMAPTDQVNPRQFRISVSYLSVEPEGYGYATYSDVSYHQGEEDKLLVVRRIERYADEREMGLDLSAPVPTEICAEIKDIELQRLEDEAYMAENPDAAPDGEYEMGLYLHYTSRGSAPITDLAGNGLEPFGAQWALNYGARYIGQNGQMPVARLDLLVKVPCFKLPDGYEYMEELEEAYEDAAYDSPRPIGGGGVGIRGGTSAPPKPRPKAKPKAKPKAIPKP